MPHKKVAETSKSKYEISQLQTFRDMILSIINNEFATAGYRSIQ